MMSDHKQAEALRQWLKYPTWSIREGLLLLAGIDPLRADCLRFNEDCTEFEASADPESLPTVDGVPVGGPTWCRLGSPERIESGPDGSLHIVGAVFALDDWLRLHQLMEHWSRTPEHDGVQRATPAQFIAVAERAGLPPTWLEAASLAGLLPHQSEPPTCATPAPPPGAAPTHDSASAPAGGLHGGVATPATPEAKEARQARRYQMCVDAGLSMPSDTYANLPRGISEMAKREGISRQAFAEDVKAHIGRLYGR